ncbi:MAG: hypothetical protein ACYDBV_02595 [Nitrospiria bacterium]
MILEVLKSVSLKTKNGPKVFQPGQTLKADPVKAQPLIEQGYLRPVEINSDEKRVVMEGVCQSVQYSETGLISCGSSGWLCDRCRGAGDGLKTVYFWSDSLSTLLDLTLPEINLYDYKKVMKARSRREQKRESNE